MTVRVLHVLVPEPEGSVGGADAHVRDLAAAQLNSGTSSPVVFATLSPSFARQVRATGVECRSTAGAGARAVLPTLRALLRERADVVHSHGYDATWWTVAALATLRRPPPLVVTCHGWIETSPKLRVMSALDRLANRSAAGIVLVSEELVPVALRHAARARAIAVVPNGVPIRPLRDRGDARCALGLPSDRLVVAAMGRLTTEKRHDVFVEAAARIAKRRMDVVFVLAGEGPLRKALVDEARRAGLGDRFVLLGCVADPDAVFAAANVVVQPSNTETTSRVILEAMAQARPVVATAVGGTPSIVRSGTTGRLIPPGDVDALMTATLELLDDPAAASRIGLAARARVNERFAVAEMAAAVDDVYRAVLGGLPRRPGTWTRDRHRPATKEGR